MRDPGNEVWKVSPECIRVGPEEGGGRRVFLTNANTLEVLPSSLQCLFQDESLVFMRLLHHLSILL